MKLRDYCKKEGISQEFFAHLIEVSPSHVCQIIKGIRNPSIHLIRKIEEVTNGLVRVSDLIHPKSPSRLKSRKKKTVEKIKT